MKARFILLGALSLCPVFAQPASVPASSQSQQAQTAKHSATTPAHRLNAKWWSTRHQQKVEAARKTDCELLFIGDSITHGWEGRGKEDWNTYYRPRKAFNLGFSGDRTQHVLWRFQNGELAKMQPKVAVLMIGTNNTGHSMQKAEQTAAGIRAIITELHQHSPKTKVLLLGIFPRGATKDDPKRQLNTAINQIIQTYHNGDSIHYLNLDDAFLDKDGKLHRSVMPDLLHPHKQGYRIWAKAMEPKLKQLLGEQ